MSSQELFWKGKTETINYDRKGKKNQTRFPDFIEICKMSQNQLKNHLVEWGNKTYQDVDTGDKSMGVCGDGYIYIRGNIPVLLTAHMDTVHKELVKDFYEYKNNIISSPQGIGGDDRCGIYMIKKIVETTNLRPYILFCEDEEIGGVGSNKFCTTKLADELKDLRFMIELDRVHANDLVYYDDENTEFHKFCEKVTGYKESYGSFSDISNLSPEAGVSSVNISCGYYNAHTTSEYVVMSEMENSIKATIKLIEAGVSQNKQYEYEDNSRYNFASYYTNDYYGHEEPEVYIFWAKDGDDPYGKEYCFSGTSLEEAVGTLLISNPELKWSDITDYCNY